MNVPRILCFLACFAFIAPSFGSDAGKQASELPTVEISLAAPMNPWPHISSVIGQLEGSREEVEEAKMVDVHSFLQRALRKVEKKIVVITDHLLRTFEDPALRKALTMRLVESEHGRGKSNFRALSFLSKKENIPAEDAINVQVQKGIAADANAIASKIRALEQSRQAGESKFFKLAAAEIDDLADAFISEFQAQVDKQVNVLFSLLPRKSQVVPASFLQIAESKEANIRVVPSDSAYPSVEAMMADMESRRDVAENLVHHKVAMDKFLMLQAANAMAKNRLEAVVGVIHRQLQAAARLH